MNSVIQMINEKLSRASLVDNGSSTGSNQSTPGNSRSIPFTVPKYMNRASTDPTQQLQPTTPNRKSSLISDSASFVAASFGATAATGGGTSTTLNDNSKVKIRTFDYTGSTSLGSLDPRLYKKADDDDDDDYDIPDNHIGRIWFRVEYEKLTEKLLVTVIKARNLVSRLQMAPGDFFVRIYLLPDERRYLQSKFKRKVTNPQFDESFVFQASGKGLDERILKITVYEADRHKRHVIVGHALYSLKDHNLSGNDRVVVWRDLEREVTESALENGELLVSLCYKSQLERITVGIFEGKNLKKLDDLSLPDAYVKVSLLQQSKVVKTKKTEIIRRSDNPLFNESFTFKLPPASLDTTSISITAMISCTPPRDRLIGRVILGSFMFSRGKELDHWNKMAANGSEQVIQWHRLT